MRGGRGERMDPGKTFPQVDAGEGGGGQGKSIAKEVRRCDEHSKHHDGKDSLGNNKVNKRIAMEAVGRGTMEV